MDTSDNTLVFRKPNHLIVMVPTLGKLSPISRKLYNVLLHDTQAQAIAKQAAGEVIRAGDLFEARLADLLVPFKVDAADLSTVAKAHFREMKRTEVEWEAPDQGSEVVWASMSLLSEAKVTEAMLRVLEFLPIEHDQLGTVRQRSGNRSQYASPGNMYRTSDGRWASIAASTQSIYERLCRALDLQVLLDDPRFLTNASRVQHRDEVDAIVGEAIGRLTLAELGQRLDKHEVGFSPIHDIQDVFSDPHFKARGTLVSVEDEELGRVRMQGVVPRFSRTPGAVRATGPRLGEHNSLVWQALGLDKDDLASLRARKVL
ncbi:CoA transferase [Hydrogenophaga sp.]|uniref:CoA transferase n=1 Tax=Hydrogenophaga sp. TaxID=1904254 RepID=UPI002CC125ED|nr:CoA transferase [Hydrogenophaga sp.]HMP09485.1 CoA transferase [Hydrogenophaga sp.]